MISSRPRSTRSDPILGGGEGSSDLERQIAHRVLYAPDVLLRRFRIETETDEEFDVAPAAFPAGALRITLPTPGIQAKFLATSAVYSRCGRLFIVGKAVSNFMSGRTFARSGA